MMASPISTGVRGIVIMVLLVTTSTTAALGFSCGVLVHSRVTKELKERQSFANKRTSRFCNSAAVDDDFSSNNVLTRETDVAVSNRNELHRREIFSIAPMMGHTNRHYRYFVRLFSKRSHLYTEMVPSAQILRAYRRARTIYLNTPEDDRGSYRYTPNDKIHSQEILEVVARMSQNPEKEFQCHGRERGDDMTDRTLSNLIGSSMSPDGNGNLVTANNIVLQLGGRDPQTLGAAAAIGTALENYDSVNLNCGCPSNAVGGRSGGAVLMKDPSLVAECVEAMNDSICSLQQNQQQQADSGEKTIQRTTVTVKHRLGVKDASTYDGVADRQHGDTDAFKTCRAFVKAITLSGAVQKCHVHARLGLLGEFLPGKDENEEESSNDRRQKLWVPGQAKDVITATTLVDGIKRVKINHKREQERAKKRAREATIKNRDVPPLRPSVVHKLVEEFPHVEFVTNGGIQTLEDVRNTVEDDSSKVVGAMVGRAAINHPCAFSSADTLWETGQSSKELSSCKRPTRGEVLLAYISYCDREEDQLLCLGVSSSLAINALRRRLVAVPFHLFVGESGNDLFQRRIKKLTNKMVSLKASSILSGAASFLPDESLDKCVDDHVSWDSIPVYDGSYRRSSALQRVIY